ncbi:hypothetical protein CCP4SC76_3420007 [Gammaproteobacteria bacterium]
MLLEALQCLADNLPYGVTVETWLGQPPVEGKPRVIVRRVYSHEDEIEYFCSSNEQWVEVIQAVGVLHGLPRNVSEWDDIRLGLNDEDVQVDLAGEAYRPPATF